MLATGVTIRNALWAPLASVLLFALMSQALDSKNISAILRDLNQTLSRPSEAHQDALSRAALAALMTQTGLTEIDIPEFATLTQRGNPLSAITLIEKRAAIQAAMPLGLPAEGWFASGFGRRMDPITHRKTDHKGLDISNNMGTPVYATADGIIRHAGKFGKFGNHISIVHGYGILTKYGHLKDINVKQGQFVKRGDLIGTMGNSGKSTGIHLHYEIWVNDRAFNPYVFLPKVMNHEDPTKRGTPGFMLLAGQP